jgi:hypothetical protein
MGELTPVRYIGSDHIPMLYIWCISTYSDAIIALEGGIVTAARTECLSTASSSSAWSARQGSPLLAVSIPPCPGRFPVAHSSLHKQNVQIVVVLERNLALYSYQPRLVPQTARCPRS